MTRLSRLIRGRSACPVVAGLFALACALAPTTVAAQEPSRWGVVGSLSPGQGWNVDPKLSSLIFDHGGTATIDSTDFSIGIGRGRMLSGDWGVSYVRRTLKDDSRFDATTDYCTGSAAPSGAISMSCATVPESLHVTRGVAFSGIEAHKFVPFFTVRRRVQAGLTVAGGIGSFSGELDRTEYGREIVIVGGRPVERPTERLTREPARDFPSFSPFPIGRVEAAVAVLAAPGFKVRASGGFNFPGYRRFSISGIYFPGAR